MKYKLVTDGEKFAVQRKAWWTGKEYLSPDSGTWWGISSEYMYRCWMSEERAREALRRIRNEMNLQEVKE